MQDILPEENNPAGAGPVATDRLIRWLAGLALTMLAIITGIVSYLHALAVVHDTGSTGLVAYLIPFVADLMIVTASLALLDAARNAGTKPKLAVVGLAVGIGSTVAMNVTAGLGHGAGGALVASLPPVALVLSLETLMGLVKRARQAAPTVPADVSEGVPISTPAGETDTAATVPASVPEDVPAGVPIPRLPGAPAAAPNRARKRAPSTAKSVPAAVPVAVPDAPKSVTERAQDRYAEHIISGAPVPSLRTLMAEMKLGQDKARQARAHLVTLAPMNGHAPA